MKSKPKSRWPRVTGKKARAWRCAMRVNCPHFLPTSLLHSFPPRAPIRERREEYLKCESRRIVDPYQRFLHAQRDGVHRQAPPAALPTLLAMTSHTAAPPSTIPLATSSLDAVHIRAGCIHMCQPLGPPSLGRGLGVCFVRQGAKRAWEVGIDVARAVREL